jgi:hypothetical protein
MTDLAQQIKALAEKATVEAGEVWTEAYEAAMLDKYAIHMQSSKAATAIISAAITAAEQRGAERERGKVVAWIKAENELCDCYAHSAGECACGAWYGNKSWPFDRFADAIETGAHDV